MRFACAWCFVLGSLCEMQDADFKYEISDVDGGLSDVWLLRADRCGA